MPNSQEFYRIQKLPPYVFAVINEMKAKARAAQQDVIDLGMGNPDGPTPRTIVNKMIEAARNPRNHRYSQSKGIPRLREEIVKRYKDYYDVDLDLFRQIVELAREYESMIVHDFAYADLCFDGYKAPSILQVPGAKEVAVEIYSMSKSFNMAGWRIGFCLGNRKMIGALARIKSYLDYGVFQPLQIAAIIALRECADDTRKICEVYRKRRDALP